MQRLNAIDSIAPAFTRTHQVLFSPFRFGRSWKLSACFYVAFAGSIFVPFPVFFFGLPRLLQAQASAAAPGLSVLLAIASVVFLLLFYLCVRMEMVAFGLVVQRATLVGPLWRAYGRRVWHWLGLKVLAGTLLTLVMAPTLVRAGIAFFAAFTAFASLMPRLGPGQTPDPAVFAPMIQQMVHVQTILLFFFFMQKAISTVLYDFVLPFYLMEPISLTAACARGLGVMAADPVNVLLYLGMKLILSFVGYIAVSIASTLVLVPVLLVSAIAGAFGLGFFALVTHASSAAGHLLVYGVAVLVYGALVALLVYLQIGILGYLLALLESYAIYFLGGRYALLGDTLEPPTAAPYVYTPPPPASPPDEGNDSGPTTPMNPAIA